MDKLKHFGACLTIALIVGVISGPVAGLVLAMVVGIAKEDYDRNHGGLFDWQDIVADATDTLVGAMLLSS